MRGRAFRQRGDEIVDGPRISHGHVHRVRQLQRGGERPRTAELDLEWPAEAVEHLFEHVQIGGEHGSGSRQVTPRPVGQPPAARGNLGRQVDQQREGSSDQVRARSPVGQLGQIGEAGQLAGHYPHCLRRISPRHGSDPGSASGWPRIARLVLVISHTSSLELPGDKPRLAPAGPGRPHWQSRACHHGFRSVTRPSQSRPGGRQLGRSGLPSAQSPDPSRLSRRRADIAITLMTPTVIPMMKKIPVMTATQVMATVPGLVAGRESLRRRSQ